MKLAPPNYTQIPNALLDALPEFSGAELSLLLYVCRETFGWHRPGGAVLSTKDFRKGTGLATETLTIAIKRCLHKGLLKRRRVPKGRGSFCYSLTVSEIETVMTPTVSEIETVTVSEIEKVAGRTYMYPKETCIKKEKGVPSKVGGMEQSVKDFIHAWTERHQELLGTLPAIRRPELKSVSALLAAGITRAEALKVAERAWVGTGFWSRQSVSLESFCRNFNQVRHEVGLNGSGRLADKEGGAGNGWEGFTKFVPGQPNRVESA